jgi:nucleotide-binding universal stress UspA family protein
VKILLAVDDTPESMAALQSVIDRPWAENSSFRVLSVVEPFHPEYSGWHTSYVPIAIEAQKELVEATKKLVDETVSKLKEKFGEANVSGEVREGYIKESIVEGARDWQAEVIVMGTHGRRGLIKFLLGSVAEAVLAEAPCSVEIIR